MFSANAREHSLWLLVRNNLAPYGDLERVENRVNKGTPDVQYCFAGGKEGWLELKDVGAWPSNPSTPLRLAHVTRDQREWWRRRARADGCVFVLLRVARDYLLFSGPVAADVLGTSTRAELLAAAQFASSGAFPKVLLIKHLIGHLK